MSPTVFRERGYRFYFFSREESRKHVHVHGPDGEAKFWLEPEIGLAKIMGYLIHNWLKSETLSRSTLMNSPMPGIPSSGAEITNVSSHGLWLLSNDTEYFLSYDDFPWFKDAPVGKILNIEEPSPGHFYWPDLDVDLGADTIEHPDRYPLKSK